MNRLPSLLAIAALVAATAGLVALLPADGFFSGDAGAKLLQAEAFAGCDTPPCEIPWPGRSLDPARALRPSYTAPGREGLVSLFPYLYPAAAAPLVPVLGGGRALRAVSAIAALLAALVAGSLATGRGRSGVAAGAAVLGATPLAFHAASVWEHAPATLMVLAAVALVVRGGRDGLAGLALGLAFWLRTESLVYGAALALGLAVTERGVRRWLPLGAGSAAGLLLGAAGQRLLLGTVVPLHLAANPSAAAGIGPGALAARLRGLAELFAPDPVTGAAAAAMLGAIGVALWRRSRRAALLSGVVALAAALTASFVAPAVRVALGSGLAASFPLRSIPGVWMFAAALPLVALAPAGDAASHRADRLVAVTAAVPLAAFWLLSPLPGGYQWGGRYFLPSAVLLAVLAWRAAGRPALRADRPARALVGVAFAGSVIVELLGLALLWHVASGNASLAREVLARTHDDRPVICATRWLPEVLAPAWETRTILRVDRPEQAPVLARGIARGGVREWDLFAVEEDAVGGVFDALPCEPVFRESFVTPGRATRHEVRRCTNR
ncbi:MAG: hypothetical protein Kow0062_05920 [Acidobacteriota bacterium]